MSVIFSLRLKELKKSKRIDDSLLNESISLKGDNGSTIILVHGMTGSPFEMKYLAGHFHRKGYSVIAPRLANHGQPLDILKRSTWQDFYGSVRRVMTTGDARDAKGPIFVSGLSLGSLLALNLADEFPGRIKGVSCLAPTLFYDGWNTPDSKFFLPFAYKTWFKHFFYFKEEPPYGIKNEAVQSRIHRYYNNAKLDSMDGVSQYGYPFFPVALLNQLQLLVKHISKKLPDMKVPVQLIQAKDDDMASVANSKFIYDHVGSEVKEMILLYNSYHVITADQERDVVAEKMEAFFNRVRDGAK
jgi:carboxylesterase